MRFTTILTTFITFSLTYSNPIPAETAPATTAPATTGDNNNGWTWSWNWNVSPDGKTTTTTTTNNGKTTTNTTANQGAQNNQGNGWNWYWNMNNDGKFTTTTSNQPIPRGNYFYNAFTKELTINVNGKKTVVKSVQPNGIQAAVDKAIKEATSSSK